MTRNATKEGRGGQRVVAKKRRSKRIMNCACGKSRKKGSDYTGGWKRDSDPCTCSQELWVSHIFADVRTTKSFSLAALFSTRKSCSVTALSYETAAAPLRANQKDAFSLSLSSFFSPISFPFSRKNSIQISVRIRRVASCASTRGIFVNISPHTQWQWQVNN